jgi:hypothetical protein
VTTVPPESPPRRRLARWPASRRGRVATIVVAALVAAVIAFVVTNPLATSPSNGGFKDNAYPTGKATVTQQTLSSQTEVSATLGYAGSFTVSVPSGTSASTITQASSTLQLAEAQVKSDRTALAHAAATAAPTNAATLAAARATVSNDDAALSVAQSQLAADENLGCPASSSATVSSPVGTGSTGTSSASQPSLRTSNSSASSSTESPADQSSRIRSAHDAGAPTATTGPADATTSTTSRLTGTVNPNGAETTYYFEYGTSPNFGSTTPLTGVGVGTADVAITATLSGLAPGDTYYYRLVATNYFATVYGQPATFQTSATPSVTTGSATSLSATTESLSGQVNPNGTETTYYFEYGTTSSFGATSPVTDAGGGQQPLSVTANVSGLSPGVTYDFALVATSALGKSVGATLTFQSAASSCVSEAAVIAEDTSALAQAKYSLETDELGQGAAVESAAATLRSDEAAVSSDEQALSLDEVNATNANTTITKLPAPGTRLHRGQAVYDLNDQPVPLFYGGVTLYRALSLGDRGPDVAELNTNLSALGFENAGSSVVFSSETAAAVRAWQGSLGERETGVVALGDVTVEPGAIEVSSLSASNGQVVTGGMSILKATSRTPVVTIALDVSLQGEVNVGDPVTITLPNNATTPGVVTSIGKVAVAPSSSSSSTNPTITVEVTPTKLAAVGNYDQAPVNVSITSATVRNALAVPIDALLALANGGDAIEEIDADGVHHLVAVTLGLFDDAAGLVQVSGSGLSAGQFVVVPKL